MINPGTVVKYKPKPLDYDHFNLITVGVVVECISPTQVKVKFPCIVKGQSKLRTLNVSQLTPIPEDVYLRRI